METICLIVSILYLYTHKIAILGVFFCIYEKKAVPLRANMRIYEKRIIYTTFSFAPMFFCMPPTSHA